MEITIYCDQTSCTFNKKLDINNNSFYKCTHPHPNIQFHDKTSTICNSKDKRVMDVTNCDHVGYGRHTVDSDHIFCAHCGNLAKG